MQKFWSDGAPPLTYTDNLPTDVNEYAIDWGHRDPDILVCMIFCACVGPVQTNQRRHNGQLSKAILVINLVSTYRICSSSLRAPYIRAK